MTTPDPATLRETLDRIDATPMVVRSNPKRLSDMTNIVLAARRWLDVIEAGKAKLPCEHSRYDRHPDPNSVIGNFCPGGMLVTP